ncbi:MAG: single-stranded DNA-binding protein [Alistipes sp.]|nr:single-stranded DNA-binding protein [Alistipes sp.]
MINKVILVGNVGADPEVRTLESGVKVARIRLATTERIYNRQTQEAREHTEWHTVTLWRNMADTADRFVRKGSQIYIEGRIRSNEWTGNDGAKRYGIEIMADDLKLLGRRGDSPAGQQRGYGQQGAYGQPAAAVSGEPAAASPQEPVMPSPADDIDDLPF